HVIQLTEHIFSESNRYSWSPDGRFLAIDNQLGPAQSTILIIDIASKVAHKLIILNGVSVAQPAWKP
ncbi:MAG: hypothetical protein ABI847_13365, partial [Anaerolineales bacterium]